MNEMRAGSNAKAKRENWIGSRRTRRGGRALPRLYVNRKPLLGSWAVVATSSGQMSRLVWNLTSRLVGLVRFWQVKP